MSLLNTIKDAQLAARKARKSVATSLLTTLYAEAAMVGKNAGRESTDAEVIATLKKFAKNNAENRGYAGDRRDSDWADVLSEEQEILDSFLPKQLSDSELTTIMQTIISDNGIVGPKGMGIMMKLLKEQYDGLYDGKQAATLSKQLLS